MDCPRRLLAICSALVVLAAACASTTPRPELSSEVSASETPAEQAEPAEEPAPEPADEPSADSAEPGEEPEPVDEAEPEAEPVGPTGSLEQAEVALVEVASMAIPIAMAFAPDTGAMFVAEQTGQVWGVSPADDGLLAVSSDPVIDLSGVVETSRTEQGLLGMAIAPDSEHLYVVYSQQDGSNRLVEYTLDDGVPDQSSEREVLVIDQPQANHNGGNIVFGPDGLLYYGLGDGGGSGDPQQTGQDPTTLLGKILRIDPAGDDGSPYLIPDDNPFVGFSGRDEIWIYGVRNPWRFSFDATTGDLWIADVGQNAVEEITRLAPGAGAAANLGWNLVEGSLSFAGTAPPDHVAPLYEYGRDEGCSITGGYVYRGSQIPELDGAFVFSDFCNPELRAVTAGVDGVSHRALGVSAPSGVVSFGQGPDGELYVLSGGGIHRIVAA